MLSRKIMQQERRDRRLNVIPEKKDQELETASVTLVEGMHFVGAIDSFHIDLDAQEDVGGTSAGPQPPRLLLLALAGCTAMDVISILRKKRQQVSGLTVAVQGKRAEQHPKINTHIEAFTHVTHEPVECRPAESTTK